MKTVLLFLFFLTSSVCLASSMPIELRIKSTKCLSVGASITEEMIKERVSEQIEYHCIRNGTNTTCKQTLSEKIDSDIFETALQGDILLLANENTKIFVNLKKKYAVIEAFGWLDESIRLNKTCNAIITM